MTSLCRHLIAQEIVNWVTTAGGCVHTADTTQLDSFVASALAVCCWLNQQTRSITLTPGGGRNKNCARTSKSYTADREKAELQTAAFKCHKSRTSLYRYTGWVKKMMPLYILPNI